MSGGEIVGGGNERLAEALEAESLGRLASQARAGVFSAYSTPWGDPRVSLAKILRLYGRDKLARRVEEGEFFEAPEAPKLTVFQP